ncbi:phiSA1p31-related protein [Streptomyces sp. SID2119]|uniref:phiSA1p31-related protein n=1 Tax=Streptomyces sp. SID2119 TaxID=2690253 RepID=UPI00137139A9|nr:phiSA1p31-related protein [Streptomyces sp. SID2119]MYW28341.1 hypothetical protein [Streptomyces sp. SID2119]
MATAQYGTRTRTVEETVVVLTLTEDEADALEALVLGESGAVMERIYRALRQTEPPAPAADTFEYDGVTYELGATYRDRVGDKFTFEAGTAGPDRTPRGRFWDSDQGKFGDLTWTLREVVSSWAPLTKVTP